MNNPENNSKSVRDLLLDARGQLLNIEASMKLAVIAGDTTAADAASLASFIDLLRPTIGYIADQLEDIGYNLGKGAEKDE